MAYLLGMDEAGYGPNLGPLVISASVWRVPDGLSCSDLYEILSPAVTRHLGVAGGIGDGDASRPDDQTPPLCLIDSKLLYRPGLGLARLEAALLATMGVMGYAPRTIHELWRRIDDSAWNQWAELPWQNGFDRRLPLEAAESMIACQALALSRCLTRANVELVALKSRAVFPAAWNGLLRGANKSHVLSQLTLELLWGLLDGLADGPITVYCDKHGGRNRYGSLLQARSPDCLVEVACEGRTQSVYRWGPARRRIEVRFCMNAEQYLPAALASIASKYLRELAMLAFNAFWQARVEDLQPTAGYPEDARRFKRQIAQTQKFLGISDHLLWRDK